LNKKIKNLEHDIVQFKEKVKQLDSQLTLAKINQMKNLNKPQNPQIKLETPCNESTQKREIEEGNEKIDLLKGC
jgi:chromosome segregation ATPase